MKNHLVFKETTQPNMSYFNLHEILQNLLINGNINVEFLQIFLKHSTLQIRFYFKSYSIMELMALHQNGLRATLVIENSTCPPKMYPKTVYILFVVFHKDLFSDHFFFLIYVNDLFKASNPLMEVMFADDTNFFLSHKNIDTLFADMKMELENVSSWFK